jgi:hypothetical protein
MEDKTKIYILAIGFTLCILWIGFNQYSDLKTNYYVQGMNDGFNESINEILNYAGLCKETPITINNKTIFIIESRCLE